MSRLEVVRTFHGWARLSDGTVWPLPGEELGEADMAARHGTLSRGQALRLASVASAYEALIGKTSRQRATIVSALKRARTNTGEE